MTSDEKILHVLSVIETAVKIGAKDGVCRLDYGSLDSNKVSEVELRSILEKLSSESITEVVSTPYDLWDSDLSNSDEPKHYKLMPLNDFGNYYDDLYERVHFGIKSLSEQNHHLIYGVAEQIHEYSNIHKGNTAKVSAFEANARIWLYLGRNKVANSEIKDAKENYSG